MQVYPIAVKAVPAKGGGLCLYVLFTAGSTSREKKCKPQVYERDPSFYHFIPKNYNYFNVSNIVRFAADLGVHIFHFGVRIVLINDIQGQIAGHYTWQEVNSVDFGEGANHFTIKAASSGMGRGDRNSSGCCRWSCYWTLILSSYR